MPEEKILKRARKAKKSGKAPSTQAGEFIREEIHHIREGKHGARNTKQAVAIGLSKARRAGINVPVPARGRASEKIRRQARHDLSKGKSNRRRRPNPNRSRAAFNTLRQEKRHAASRNALSRHAKNVARKHSR